MVKTTRVRQSADGRFNFARGGLPCIIPGKAGSRARARADSGARGLEEPSRRSARSFAFLAGRSADTWRRTMDINGLLRRRLTRPSLDRVSWLLYVYWSSYVRAPGAYVCEENEGMSFDTMVSTGVYTLGVHGVRSTPSPRCVYESIIDRQQEQRCRVVVVVGFALSISLSLSFCEEEIKFD